MKLCDHCGHTWSNPKNECPVCQHLWSRSQYNIHIPTKADIAKATKRIRDTWSDATRQSRIASDLYKTVPADVLRCVENPTGRRTYKDNHNSYSGDH